MSSIIRSTDETLDGTIATFSGRKFKPLDPDIDEILPEDIAHATAMQCRFGGHVSSFYSVAQHTVHVADWLEQRYGPELAFWGLLHDASEAYLGDMVRPVKKDPAFGPFYLEAEERLMYAIRRRFNLSWPMPPEVSYADNVLLRTEQRDLMPPIFLHAGDDYYNETGLIPWSPQEAEIEWLDYYRELSDTLAN